MEKVKKLTLLAEELGISMANLALAWVLKNPRVSSAITGASKPQQLKENLKALEVTKKLTQQVMSKIENILKNQPQPNQNWKL